MTLTMIVGILFATYSSAELPSIRLEDPIPILPEPYLEKLRLQELERTRRSRYFIEEQLNWMENMLKVDRHFKPDEVKRYRDALERIRKNVEEMKKHERILWEQQPGGILAPPPREKK